MFVRIENIRNSEDVLIIDELDKFICEMDSLIFLDLIKDIEPEFFDDYTYFKVEKNEIYSRCNK